MGLGGNFELCGYGPIFVGFQRGQQYSKRLLTNDLYKVSIVGRALVLKTINTHEATDLARDTRY